MVTSVLLNSLTHTHTYNVPVAGLVVNGGDRSLYNTVDEALGFLDARTEFWRQQKPMYARKRERELKKYRPAPTRPRSKGTSGAGGDHTKYVLKALEEIDIGKTYTIPFQCIFMQM